MSNSFYGPLEPEPDIEWAELLELRAVRALYISNSFAELALDETNTPVVRRLCIQLADRWLQHYEDLLATTQRKPKQAP